MNVKYYQKIQSGYTMIELMVSLAILSIILTGMAGYFAFNISLAHDSEVRDQALRFARSAIESLKAEVRKNSGTDLKKSDLIIQSKDKEEAKKCLNNKASLKGNWSKILNREVTVEYYPDKNTESNIYLAKAKVSWAKNKSVELKTLIAKR